MSNRDRAAEIIYRTLNPKYGDFSHHEETADALHDAGLLTGGEYMELAPEHRYAVARTKEQVIISDNEARATIYVARHHVNDLVHGLLLAQAHEGHAGGAK